MMIMTAAPRIIAIAVPATPELDRNFLPGLMNEPHPITQPNAMAQTCIGLSWRLRPVLDSAADFLLISFQSSLIYTS